MATREFARQIEHLLWTGALRGRAILKLSLLLKFYQQGKVSKEKMQEAIDQYDPEIWDM
jgi:hypothetical protein